MSMCVHREKEQYSWTKSFTFLVLLILDRTNIFFYFPTIKEYQILYTFEITKNKYFNKCKAFLPKPKISFVMNWFVIVEMKRNYTLYIYMYRWCSGMNQSVTNTTDQSFVRKGKPVSYQSMTFPIRSSLTDPVVEWGMIGNCSRDWPTTWSRPLLISQII